MEQHVTAVTDFHSLMSFSFCCLRGGLSFIEVMATRSYLPPHNTLSELSNIRASVHGSWRHGVACGSRAHVCPRMLVSTASTSVAHRRRRPAWHVVSKLQNTIDLQDGNLDRSERQIRVVCSCTSCSACIVGPSTRSKPGQNAETRLIQ